MSDSLSDKKFSLRDFSLRDLPLVDGYWARQTTEDLQRMSVDSSKLFTRTVHIQALEKQIALPVPERTEQRLMWELDGRRVGMCILRNIRFGESGEIHFHMFDPALRKSGYGARFFALSARELFRRFELKMMVCEPSAKNPAPNQLLQKLGFRVARTERKTPSPICFEHEINRYEITRLAVESLAA